MHKSEGWAKFVHLNELNKLDGQALANHRFNKFRNIGTFIN